FIQYRSGAWKWLAVSAALLIAFALGYLVYLNSQRGVQDGLYAGPICYGPGRDDPARCYRAQAILSNGKLTGRWPGRDPGVTVFLSGEVLATQTVQIELRSESTDGTQLHLITLAGSLRDGRIDATGNFEGGQRTASLSWQHQ